MSDGVFLEPDETEGDGFVRAVLVPAKMTEGCSEKCGRLRLDVQERIDLGNQPRRCDGTAGVRLDSLSPDYDERERIFSSVKLPKPIDSNLVSLPADRLDLDAGIVREHKVLRCAKGAAPCADCSSGPQRWQHSVAQYEKLADQSPQRRITEPGWLLLHEISPVNEALHCDLRKMCVMNARSGAADDIRAERSKHGQQLPVQQRQPERPPAIASLAVLHEQ